MNDSIYEEYMRNVLGYQPVNYDNTYDMEYNRFENFQMQELENCYPDIYKIVYPMVQKVCSQNTKTLTKELVDNMTDEIYFAIEDKEMLENRNNKDEKKSEPTENRQIVKNKGLNDLIRILILRELLWRPGFPGGRPPRPRPPRPPMRPPMSHPMGPPPRPLPRPGMRGGHDNQIFDLYDELYEY